MNKDIKAVDGERTESVSDYSNTITSGSKLFLIIASILVAFLIWIYASSQENGSKTVSFENIPVTISTSNSLSVLNNFDYTVDVVLSGTGKNLSKLTESNISAIVDASDITESGKYTLDVVIEYPGDTALVSQSLNNVVLELDKIATVMVEAEVSLGNYNISEPYEIAEINTDYESIAVSGPSKLVSKIDHAVISIDAGHLQNTTIFGGSVYFVDENGKSIETDALTYDAQNPTVSVVVYTKKLVPLKAEFKGGYYDNLKATISISPEYITVKGEASVLSDITEISLPVIDERLVLSDTVTKEIVLPSGVYMAQDITTATVSISLSGYEDVVCNIPADKIEVFNPNELNYSIVSSGVAVTLRGKYTIMSEISDYEIKGHIDLSGYDSSVNGTISVPITIVYPTAIKGSIYEIGSYTVLVAISR